MFWFLLLALLFFPVLSLFLFWVSPPKEGQERERRFNRRAQRIRNRWSSK